nr:hypothetical protein [Candidatus Baldrarchaeota archaeon]
MEYSATRTSPFFVFAATMTAAIFCPVFPDVLYVYIAGTFEPGHSCVVLSMNSMSSGRMLVSLTRDASPIPSFSKQLSKAFKGGFSFG